MEVCACFPYPPFPFCDLDYFFLTGIIVHNLSSREQIVEQSQAHKGKVSGLCFTDDNRLLSCGVDRNIKLWAIGGQTTDLV
jgi:DDB1- and CUL4-associated factor 13